MAVPKKKKTRARSDQRRSHHALGSINIIRCANCGAGTRPHMACPSCGFYRGRKLTGSYAETKLAKMKAEKKEEKAASKNEKTEKKAEKEKKESTSKK